MSKNTLVTGYTTGVYDLFHVGHLNLLRAAKAQCDRLVVGVSTDAVVAAKHKRAVIPYEDRVAIVRAIKFVDAVIPQTTTNKIEEYEKLQYDILFVGDDWYKDPRWTDYRDTLGNHGVKVIFLPYTDRVSTTSINNIIAGQRT